MLIYRKVKGVVTFKPTKRSLTTTAAHDYIYVDITGKLPALTDIAELVNFRSREFAETKLTITRGLIEFDKVSVEFSTVFSVRGLRLSSDHYGSSWPLSECREVGIVGLSLWAGHPVHLKVVEAHVFTSKDRYYFRAGREVFKFDHGWFYGSCDDISDSDSDSDRNYLRSILKMVPRDRIELKCIRDDS